MSVDRDEAAVRDAHLLIARAKDLAGLGYGKGYDDLLFELCDALDAALARLAEQARAAERLEKVIRDHWSPSQAEAILARREARDG